ncbi:MAG: hypothetical protein J6P53_00295 [Mailhella sp.]|nr:hypothetical protein [Mailhella sp.]
MLIAKTIKAFTAFAAVFLMLSSASTARDGLPEVSLDIFAQGMGSGVISVLQLQAEDGGKELRGPVSWNGHELAAGVRMEDGRVASAMLKGMQDDALTGRFMTEMAERNMLPALVESDGARSDLMREAFDKGMDKEQCRRYAEEAMGRWASQGKKAFGILFLPEEVFMQAAADMRGLPGAPLEEIIRHSLGFDPNLVPQSEKMAFGLFLDRADGSLALRIGSVEHPGSLLENWNGQRAEKP